MRFFTAPDSRRVPLTRNPRVARIPASPRRGEAKGSGPYFGLTFGSPPGLPGGGITEEFLRNAHTDIPDVVEAMRQYWMPTRYARAR
ncbi:hypothetical protein [Bradyrhizobium sp. WBAH23]|uniref:hypothetical protein n=1 Tax=Bradyrhizobium sp. WBAH23 TaxID=1390119 RepID=UPI00223F97E9|nr:hypothetical protein [Bradyrhizobium sp. WBAH23]